LVSSSVGRLYMQFISTAMQVIPAALQKVFAMSVFHSDYAFAERLAEPMRALYQTIWKGCAVTVLSSLGSVHPLDKEFGIDILIRPENGGFVTVQEKIRRAKYLEYQDVIFESRNGDGSAGEWQHLGAHYYVVAYADEDETGIDYYLVLNVPQAVDIITREFGGLHMAGSRVTNELHGGARGYAVPWYTLAPAVAWTNIPQLQKENGAAFAAPAVNP